ncbi:hypothetical protein ACFW04_002884 [Cataglyphis niger]
MALISRDIFRNWWDDMDRWHREVEDNFGQLNLRHNDIWRSPSPLFRPWRDLFENMDRQVGGAATVEHDDDKYQERKDSHGYVSRQFVRRYVLPKGYDIGHVKPSLSSDGILTITAPRLALPAPGERIVPVERSNKPAINA